MFERVFGSADSRFEGPYADRLPGGERVPGRERVLAVSFPNADAFWHEYNANLANAGVFVASRDDFRLRELVVVELVLEFAGESVQLQGEVVHHVPPEMAGAGGTPGVAIQFRLSAFGVREKLAPLLRACGAFHPEPGDPGRRATPRVPARVPTQIVAGDRVIEAHTRNLSRSGVLIAVSGETLPVGKPVRVSLRHPQTGEAMEIEGRVAREVCSRGQVSALGIHFDPSEERRDEVERFIEDVQSVEHSKRLGGITGSVAELGMQSLLQMFGASASKGTLTLERGEQEGAVGFEGGLLRFARLGTITGMKAMIRLLAWQHGSFEFHSRLESSETAEAPLPLEAALLEATTQLDEMARIDRSSFPGEAQVRLPAGAGASGEPTCKVEEAILDLARAGFSVQRIVEVIPEPDPAIYRAFATLSDRGAIVVER